MSESLCNKLRTSVDNIQQLLRKRIGKVTTLLFVGFVSVNVMVFRFDQCVMILRSVDVNVMVFAVSRQQCYSCWACQYQWCLGLVNVSNIVFGVSQYRCYGSSSQSMSTLWLLGSVSVNGMLVGSSQC